MSESKSTNCFRISSIICKVTGDKKFSQQYDLSVRLLFASFHPSNAFRSAIWSLKKENITYYHLHKNIQEFMILTARNRDQTCKNHRRMTSLHHQLPPSGWLAKQTDYDKQVQQQLSMLDLGIGRSTPWEAFSQYWVPKVKCKDDDLFSYINIKCNNL